MREGRGEGDKKRVVLLQRYPHVVSAEVCQNRNIDARISKNATAMRTGTPDGNSDDVVSGVGPVVMVIFLYSFIIPLRGRLLNAASLTGSVFMKT